ncbi:pantoate--beta-alanine ligase [Legionella sp. CNM-4043-24]|uniref:pantoate--beta-alanine ligase n=1 Tax=Legionella sp. CNM-4043-24 TaxID=3421646 RepID=UPI00403A98EF
MHIFHQLDEWQAFRRSLKSDVSIGFVPTMGNLHAGHASLMATSKARHDMSVVSLFINPTQFNRPDDFIHYPRSVDADLELLEREGVDCCLLPDEEAMYQDQYRYRLEETSLSLLMEGEHRPGHFNGVLTVVMKLLNLVKPHTAYFGEKDYQQYRLIKDMVKAFFMPVNIQACPTIRESSGLAYSSRNNRLSPSQKLLAEAFARSFHQTKPLSSIQAELQQQGVQVEYLTEHEGRRYAAVLIGDVRLIDNYPLV